MSDLESVLDKLSKLRVWHQRGQSAPHKPLLMLYALGEYSKGKKKYQYTEIDEKLSLLLREFGPSTDYVHTEYPFWRLQKDKVWKVITDSPMESGSGSTDALKSELMKKDAEGQFPEDVALVLDSNPMNLKIMVKLLLDNNFPDTLHQDILSAVGLNLDSGNNRKVRSPEFRREVLRAYERKCSVCGYDLLLGGSLAGIEAAHIKWHQAGGPDTVSNGLALCTLHHKVFDMGGFTIEPKNLTMIFSKEISGENQRDWLLGFHGKPLRSPQSKSERPDKMFLDWHRETIFKKPSRDWHDQE